MAADPSVLQVRRYGRVNWLGLWTLYEKEVRRQVKVVVQTLIAPAVQTLLFMAVLTIAFGQVRKDALGVTFAEFLGPGLVMMAMLGNAFANSSTSIIVSKMQGSSIDYLMPPLSAAELTAAYVAGAVTRGLGVGVAGLAAIAWFAPVKIADPVAIVYYAVAGGVIMGALGALAGIWANKFDHLAAVQNFVVSPLTFLSGTFYSVAILPEPFSTLTHANPVFHLIDGFRSGFIGAADGDLTLGAVMVGVLAVALTLAVWFAFRRGWRLKS